MFFLLAILLAAGLAAQGWRTQRREVAFFLASVMLFLMVNALVCASGSSTHDRYQGRVVWLLPFVLVLSAGWLREDRNAESDVRGTHGQPRGNGD